MTSIIDFGESPNCAWFDGYKSSRINIETAASRTSILLGFLGLDNLLALEAGEQTVAFFDELDEISGTPYNNRYWRERRMTWTLQQHWTAHISIVFEIPLSDVFREDIMARTLRLRNLFEAEIDDDKYIRRMFADLVRFTQDWNTTSVYYSPHTSLLQASMTGKSRAVRELARQHVFVFYTCFRLPGASGYPRATTPLVELVNKMNQCKLRDARIKAIKVLFLTMLETFVRWVQDTCEPTPAKFWDTTVADHNDHNSFWRDLIYQYDKRTEEVECDEKVLEERLIACGQQFRKETDKVGHTLSSQELRLLFVFDEGSYLFGANDFSDKSINLFLDVRLVLRELFKCNHIFALFVDTTSKVSAFSAVRTAEMSVRETGSRFQEFPPLHLIATHDVWSRRKDKYLRLDDVAKAEHYVTFGRPFWNQYSTDREYRDVVRLARKKLQSGIAQENPNPLDIIAAMSVIYDLDIVPTSTLARELSFYRMAYVLFISKDHNRIVTRYGSEPVLAHGAHDLLHNVTLREQLVLLSRNIRQGKILRGSRGELLGRILMTQCLNQSGYQLTGHPDQPGQIMQTNHVPVKVFLSHLCKGNCEGWMPEGRTAAEIEILVQGMIHMSHWICVSCTITPKLLAMAFNRGAGIVCQEGQFAVDLVIPVLLPLTANTATMAETAARHDIPVYGADGETPVKWTDDQSEYISQRFSVILIQCKNTAKYDSQFEARHTKMDYAVIDIFGRSKASVKIYMQFGDRPMKAPRSSFAVVEADLESEDPTRPRKKIARLDRSQGRRDVASIEIDLIGTGTHDFLPDRDVSKIISEFSLHSFDLKSELKKQEDGVSEELKMSGRYLYRNLPLEFGNYGSVKSEESRYHGH